LGAIYPYRIVMKRARLETAEGISSIEYIQRQRLLIWEDARCVPIRKQRTHKKRVKRLFIGRRLLFIQISIDELKILHIQIYLSLRSSTWMIGYNVTVRVYDGSM